MTRAVIIAALCCLAFGVAPAAARQRQYAFLITSASMSETMTFQGDGGPDCQRSGVCGYSGTVKFSFSAGDGIAGFVASGRRLFGRSQFFFAGLTSANVQGPGGGPPCTDEVLHGGDRFSVGGTAKSFRLIFHPAFDRPRYLDTYCTGPSDRDMADTRALPAIPLSERALRRNRLHLQVSSTRPFHAGPFVGTLAFSVDMRWRRVRHLGPIFQFLAL